MTEHPRPEPTPTVAELRRTEHRAEPPAPELVPSADELSVDAQLRGIKLRGGARGAGIPALKHVLIVLIVVAGAVAIVRSFVTSPEARRPDVSRCIAHPHTEGIECTRDGS